MSNEKIVREALERSQANSRAWEDHCLEAQTQLAAAEARVKELEAEVEQVTLEREWAMALVVDESTGTYEELLAEARWVIEGERAVSVGGLTKETP